jgi:hypothetical protein
MDEQGLKSTPLFAGLKKKERRSLATRTDQLDVPEGKQLIRPPKWS